MPFVPEGRLRHVGVVLRRRADRWPAARWGRCRRQSLRGRAHRQDHDVHRRAGRRRGRPGVRGARHAAPTRSISLRLQTQGIVRLVDGRDLWRWRLRRAARRQRVGQRRVTVLQLDIVVVVLRRRLHGRGQQGTAGHHQSVPVRRDRQHQRGNQHREPRTADPADACSSSRSSVLVISQDLLGQTRARAGHHGHQHPWPGGGRAGTGVPDVGRPRRLHDDARRAFARRAVLLRRWRGRRPA